MPPKTASHRLADLLLEVPLRDYVTLKRAEGLSWRRISLHLMQDTHGELEITENTLRVWFPELVVHQAQADDAGRAAS